MLVLKEDTESKSVKEMTDVAEVGQWDQRRENMGSTRMRCFAAGTFVSGYKE